jgi:hypothetical protein
MGAEHYRHGHDGFKGPWSRRHTASQAATSVPSLATAAARSVCGAGEQPPMSQLGPKPERFKASISSPLCPPKRSLEWTCRLVAFVPISDIKPMRGGAFSGRGARGRPGEHPLRRKCPAKPYCTHFHGPMISAAVEKYSAAIPAMKAMAMRAIQ